MSLTISTAKEVQELAVETPKIKRIEGSYIDVRLSQLYSTEALTKIIHIRDGKLSKQPSTPLSRGSVKNICGSFHEFGDVLKLFSTNEEYRKMALALGVTEFDEWEGLTTKKLYNKYKKGITRTKDYFHFHNSGSVMLLDYDPRGSESLTFDEFRERISKAWPAFKTVPMWFKSSTSAGVYHPHDKANIIQKNNGFHCYIYVKDGTTIPFIGKALFQRLWLCDEGYIFISKDGGQHKRSIIDEAVFSPERIIFEAKPILQDGLVQDDPLLLFYDGDYDYELPQELSTSELVDLTNKQTNALSASETESKETKKKYSETSAREYAKTHSVSLPQAKKIIKSRLEHELSHQDFITFHEFGNVCVLDILQDLKKYDGCYCADPFEPEEGNGRAIFQARLSGKGDAGRPRIHTYLHRGPNIFISASASMFLLYQDLKKGSQDIETIGRKIFEKNLSDKEKEALFNFFKADGKSIVREYKKYEKGEKLGQEAQDAWDTINADAKRDGSVLIKVKARSESLIRSIEAEFSNNYSIFYSKGRLHRLVRNKLEAFTVDSLDTFLGEKFTFYKEKVNLSSGVVVPTVVDTPRDLARKMANHQNLKFNEVDEVVYHPYVSKQVSYNEDMTSNTIYSIFRNKGINSDTGIMSAFTQKFGEYEEKSAADLMKLMFEETALKRMDNKILVMAAVITGIQRKMILSAPGFIISSSMEKLGKTTLAQIIQTYIAGDTLPGVDLPYKKKEFSEFIFKELLHYPPCLCFDNLLDDSEIKTDGLSALLSSDRVTGRLYFSQNNAEVSSRTLMLFTGNRITCSKDLARKMINLQINPGGGEFIIQDYIGYAKAKRAEVIDGILRMIMRHINKHWPDGLTKSAMSNDFDQQVLKVLYYETSLDVWKVAMGNIRSNEKEQCETLIQVLCDLPKDIKYGDGEDNGSDVDGYLEVELLRKAISEPQGELSGVNDTMLGDLKYHFDMLQEGCYNTPRKFSFTIRKLLNRTVNGMSLQIKMVRSTRRQCLYTKKH